MRRVAEGVLRLHRGVGVARSSSAQRQSLLGAGFACPARRNRQSLAAALSAGPVRRPPQPILNPLFPPGTAHRTRAHTSPPPPPPLRPSHPRCPDAAAADVYDSFPCVFSPPCPHCTRPWTASDHRAARRFDPRSTSVRRDQPPHTRSVACRCSPSCSLQRSSWPSLVVSKFSLALSASCALLAVSDCYALGCKRPCRDFSLPTHYLRPPLRRIEVCATPCDSCRVRIHLASPLDRWCNPKCSRPVAFAAPKLLLAPGSLH